MNKPSLSKTENQEDEKKDDDELEDMMSGTRSKKFYLIYWTTVAMVFVMVTAILYFVPAKAHAAEGLAAGKASLTTQATTVKKTTSKKAVSTNPYVDVSSKTVDKKGIVAVKYVKAHKGFNGVITGKRFYPTKTFSQAQLSKILRNLYGKQVALSKSKTAVTGKYLCSRLSFVAKSVYGVKIKWKAGNGNAKLSRVGVSNYIRTFALWDGGLFAPIH